MKNPLILCLLLICGGLCASAENVFFSVYGGGSAVSGALVKVCSDESLSVGCQLKASEGGKAAFFVEPGAEPNGRVFYYGVSLQGYKLASGKSRVFPVNTSSFWIDYLVPFGDYPILRAPEINISVVLSSENAGGARLDFLDMFPGCGLSGSNPVRCGVEFLVPNFHLAAVVNLVAFSLGSVFSLDLSKIGPAALIEWMFNLLTPIFLIILLFFYELFKTFLLVSIAYLGWLRAFELMFHSEFKGGVNFLYVVIFSVLLIVLGSFLLLSVDYGFILSYLTGGGGAPVDNRGVFSAGGGSGGGGGGGRGAG